MRFYSGLNLNQDKATKPQTVQIVRQGEATPYWFKVNPLYIGAGVFGRLKEKGRLKLQTVFQTTFLKETVIRIIDVSRRNRR